MDIKQQITTAVEKITKDEATRNAFMKDPAGTVSKVLGIDIPKETLDQIVDAVKTKVNVDKVAGIAGALKGLMK